MADEGSVELDVLTKVARTVGSALGTVAAKAADLAGGRAGDSSTAPVRKSEKVEPGSSVPQRVQQKKTKRVRHKRKLARKTRG